jgi:hypothetical protein
VGEGLILAIPHSGVPTSVLPAERCQGSRNSPAPRSIAAMRLKGEKQWDWDVVHCFDCWAYRCQL